MSQEAGEAAKCNKYLLLHDVAYHKALNGMHAVSLSLFGVVPKSVIRARIANPLWGRKIPRRGRACLLRQTSRCEQNSINKLVRWLEWIRQVPAKHFYEVSESSRISIFLYSDSWFPANRFEYNIIWRVNNNSVAGNNTIIKEKTIWNVKIAVKNMMVLMVLEDFVLYLANKSFVLNQKKINSINVNFVVILQNHH